MTEKSYTTTFRVHATPEEVYAAINDPRAWWDGEFEGSTDSVGDEFTYRYEDLHTARSARDEPDPERTASAGSSSKAGRRSSRRRDEWAGRRSSSTSRRPATRPRFASPTSVSCRASSATTSCSGAWSHYVNDSLPQLVTVVQATR